MHSDQFPLSAFEAGCGDSGPRTPQSDAAAGQMEPAATALDVLAVLRGEITGPGADAIRASYFAPGPEPRYDMPQARAEAGLEAEL